ncbi:MBL fold metallo-hydrolase [Saccharothrix mutabilis subsp. mutabilis]|uniref:MBL fold metallo-hydrolase n=1 Tax=Saccharothrix mutabilis subsp. mutabilis TaxID=66855 RepID=A0ABN0UDZ8_9PSEU
MGSSAARPVEIAPGVHRLGTGRAVTEANVYLVGSAAAWVLVDAAWPGRAAVIRAAADALFGPGSRPTSIYLTHVHPDHSGAAAELARTWRVPVHLHPEETRFAAGEYLPEYAHPLDRRLIAPALRLVPRRKLAAIRARDSLEGIARAYDAERELPGLPGWECVPTPGHTAGHAAYFRRRDGVVITGDAVVTVELNSVFGLFRPRSRPCAPPRCTTWDWGRAAESVARLAALDPALLAPGHGAPLRTSGRELRELAERMRRSGH